jgi:N-acyl-D-glutamate deacylase
MKVRGRVQAGMVADLTLFNPETVAGRSTFKTGENGLPSEGIPYVIVNGVVVVKDSQALPVKPGQPIRFPVEEKGRFVPISEEKWLNDYTITPIDVHVEDSCGMHEAMEEDDSK